MQSLLLVNQGTVALAMWRLISPTSMETHLVFPCERIETNMPLSDESRASLTKIRHFGKAHVDWIVRFISRGYGPFSIYAAHRHRQILPVLWP
ncbi:MAG: hypothetical protein CV081_11995 [Nitrospira sp. LK265]|nr:hypothetical protein [Nitrospira sp. LK265]